VVADRLSIALVVVVTALAVAIGLRAGESTPDTDELVYRRTLVTMQHGAGYYRAMRSALVRKEGAPPSQVRSVRPPTMFLLLRWFPRATWRWIVGLVYLAVLLLAWRLSRVLARWGGPVAVGLAGVWLFGAASRLYLHSELWGLPFLLGGALAMRSERWSVAALCLAVAVLFRETYAVGFVAGLLWTGRRQPFWIITGVLVALAAVHVWLAQNALSSHGHENALRNGTLGVRFILDAVSPSNDLFGWVLGVGGLVLGALGFFTRWRVDAAARVLALTAGVLIPATVVVGREYWALVYGVGIACYVPAGLRLLLDREAAPAS
jgi:hypothetical protein